MHVFPRFRGSAALALCAAVAVSAAFIMPAVTVHGATPAATPLVLPPGPAKAGFEVSRADFSVHGEFEPFAVTETLPLRDALRSRVVADDTDLLLIETAGAPLALLMEQMAYHHIAQGRTQGQDWLVSFCVVCNTSTRLVPSVNGTSTRFEAAGVYDGMLIMQDVLTRTIWNHITGEALYGPAVGTTLGPLGNVLQLTVKQALRMAPEARIAISDRIYFADGRKHGTLEGLSLLGRVHGRADNRAALSPAFTATLGAEDTRRPRMDLGLGVWTDKESRYYPRELIQRAGNALIDQMEGRTLLIYLDSRTSTPVALFVTSARARMDGSVVRLDNRQTVRDGVLFDGTGRRVAVQRPMQVFTRWYGFALSLPGTTVYAQTASPHPGR